MKVEIRIDDQQAQDDFKALIARGTNLRPLMYELGEHLTETTKQRFQTSTAPDGSRWEPNTEATYLAYLALFKSSFGKDGKLTKGGAGRAAGKKPLIGESGHLSSRINYRADDTSVTIGSPEKYSAVHQFGAIRGEFGTTRRGSRIPWGSIPARPFLGISAEDEAAISEKVGAYLAGL